jgi:hypothetical protein
LVSLAYYYDYDVQPIKKLTLDKLKVKVKLPLCLTKHHAMKAYWVSGGIAPRIL